MKIITEGKMPDGTHIQLEDWRTSFPEFKSMWNTIGAYPRSLKNSGRLFGPRRGEEFRLDMKFESAAEALEAYEKLVRGDAELLDYRDRYWNGENDAELLEV